MRRDYFRSLVQRASAALATVYSCPFCKHHTVMRKGIPGVGRGYGLGQGGKLHAQMAAHIRAEHPQQAGACVAWMQADELSHALYFGLLVGYKTDVDFFAATREEREAAWEKCRKQPFREKKPAEFRNMNRFKR